MKSFLQRENLQQLPALRAPGPAVVPAIARLRTESGVRENAACGPAAEVDVVKEGDKVVRLIVTCRCGERIEIDCLYAAGA